MQARRQTNFRETNLQCLISLIAAPRYSSSRFCSVNASVWASVALLLQGTSGALAAPVVTATIAPVHSIASYIMGNTGIPQLLVPPSTSPHDFAMKPSQAEMLAGSGLVIWVGPQLEGFLVKPLETIATGKNLLTLSRLEKVKQLAIRNDDAFADDHDHGHEEGHDDDDHDSHSASS